jgi:hypothetical protein
MPIPAAGSTRRAPCLRRKPIAHQLAASGLAVALLSLPALWNGLPLVYDDVGGYLERWPTHSLGLGRSVPYGLLLWVTAPAFWVPVVILQAAVTVFVIDRCLMVFGVRRSPWIVPVAVALIAATSGAAFFVSQVIPDAWAAPGVLALHLLACHADALSRRDRVALAAIVAFAGAAHMAILAVLGGLTLVYALAWIVGERLRVAVPGLAGAIAAVGAGVALLLSADLAVTGRLAPTPGGDVILFGRLVQTGAVGKILARECPRDDWRLCAFRAELPALVEDFLWSENSPLARIGGWDDAAAKREMASIIRRSVVDDPIGHVAEAMALTARQFVTLDITHVMGRVGSWALRSTLEQHAPWLVQPFDNSRQQSGAVDLAVWSSWIVTPVSIVGSFSLPIVAFVFWRRGKRRAALLPAMVFVALVGNAFVCGVISGPSDRYQARLVWLAPLAAGVAVLGGARGLIYSIRDAGSRRG